MCGGGEGGLLSYWGAKNGAVSVSSWRGKMNVKINIQQDLQLASYFGLRFTGLSLKL